MRVLACLLAVLMGIQAVERLRLAGGPHGCAGRLEVRHGGRWGTVCDDGWDLRDAAVACRELGCGGALAAPAGAFFGEGIGPVWLSELACRGSESRLGLCRHRGWKAHICSHEEDAGLVCVGQRATNSRPDSTEPLDRELWSEGSPTSPERLRLAGGPHGCAGRLEVWHGGRWGTVCDDGWDLRDAAVACRELGCGGALAAPGGARFGEGSGPVWMDDVGCGGGEQALQDCPRSPWGRSNCDHTEDAGLVCEGPAPHLRLAGGPNGCAGRLEVWHGGRWGTVCDDGWDLRDAAVACRELGCGGALAAPGGAFFGEGAGPILLDDLRCKGNETSLGFCPARPWGQHDCHHREDAGAVCDGLPLGLPTPGSSDGAPETQTPTSRLSPASPTTLPERGPEEGTPRLRLVSGPGQCAGRLEVWYGGRWGTVCDDGWDVRDAMVACRELGCGVPREPGPAPGRFGWGEGPIWLDDVACSGIEVRLANCPAAPWGKHNCAHNEDVGVTCTGNLGPDSVPDPFSWSWAPEPRGDGQNWPVRRWTTENPGDMATQLTTSSPGTTVPKPPGRTPHSSKKWATKKPRKPTVRPPGQSTTKVPRRQTTRVLPGQATPQLTTQAPRGQSPQVFPKLTTRAPRGQSPQASPKLTTQATRGQTSQAFPKLTTQAHRGQTLQDSLLLPNPTSLPTMPVTSSASPPLATQPSQRQPSQVTPQLSTQVPKETTLRDRDEGSPETSLDPGSSTPGTESRWEAFKTLPTSTPKNLSSPQTWPGSGESGLFRLRLSDGPDRCAGRLEVWHGDVWGTVCDDGWDPRDAAVACRELGCGGIRPRVGKTYYGSGTGPIWLDDVGCVGIEASLGDCPASPWGVHNCEHQEDVGLTCTGDMEDDSDLPWSWDTSSRRDMAQGSFTTAAPGHDLAFQTPWDHRDPDFQDWSRPLQHTAAPEETPNPDLQLTADTSPQLTSDPSPQLTSDPSPQLTTESNPQLTSDLRLSLTTDPSPQLTPSSDKQLTPDPSPQLTTDPGQLLTLDPNPLLISDISQKLTSDVVLDLTSDPRPQLTPDSTPQLTSDFSPMSVATFNTDLQFVDPGPQPSPDSAPELTSDFTPKGELTPSSTPPPIPDVAPQLTSDTNQQLTIESFSQLTSDPSPQLTPNSAEPQFTPDSISHLTSDLSLQMTSDPTFTPVLTTEPSVDSQLTSTSSPTQTKQLMSDPSPSPKVTTAYPSVHGLTPDLSSSIPLVPELSPTSQQARVPPASPGLPSEYTPSLPPEPASSSQTPTALGVSPAGTSTAAPSTAPSPSPEPSEAPSMSPTPTRTPDSVSRQRFAQNSSITVASESTINPAPTPDQGPQHTTPKHPPTAGSGRVLDGPSVPPQSPGPSDMETGQCVLATPPSPTILRVMACEPPALRELVGAVKDVSKQLRSLTQAVQQNQDERRAAGLELGQLVEAIRGLGDLGQALRGLVEASRPPMAPGLQEEEEERPRRGDV
ncbi:soluble scavenger receptor cysteine-rich domain-containing protein SSC5D [Trichosurus vulpecula]|uniref:soluble scavenger receptor cysteine-rich domain-containing protein SSC5D n=1 Tax=Trichosurus vulpecula TaxID=9337 RepID=UPI00186B4575|nr:soluble scavenger receptor cysteine-rich domain-containing protein SSC5D [Trichosurus vulpecula]